MLPVRAILKKLRGSDHKVAVVFGITPSHCHRAVRHLRGGAPEVPVWLFATRELPPETADLCQRVVVAPDSLRLLLQAQTALRPKRVALAVTTWTGERGHWPVKLAPFLVSPLRALLMNVHGDFFPGRPHLVVRHLDRLLADALSAAWSRLQDIARGLWLRMFALAAQRSSALSRRVFPPRHGSRALALPDYPPSGEGTAVYRYQHRRWDWDEVNRLVNSDCRRILFLEGDTPEDELPWIDDGPTFAVSRQNAFRAWKPSLFPTAPFRPLQPDEISRTLAPLSTAILVDRARLAALGVPKTIVPGTAWLILFWKAAAAGWNTYTVGTSAPLHEQPDWPYEEAEFVHHILSDPDLRALGPQSPALKRGAIATTLTTPTPVPGPQSPTVLVVSPYLPYPLSHGGAVRIWNLCRALAGRVNFILACFREKNDTTDYARLHEVFREVYVVDRDERGTADPSLPRQVREHSSAAMNALIASLAPRVDLLQFEFTHMAAFREAAPHLPAILVEHDLTYTLYRQLAETEKTPAARREYELWLDFERRHLRAYDAVWTASGEDRDAALAEGSPAAGTWAVPNGVDVVRYTPADEAAAPTILYVGSFRHLPNIIGFEALRDEVMPRVWKRFPEARLCVVAGPDPGRHFREFRNGAIPRRMDPRIEMHEFVADLRPLYAASSVVAVPLAVSAGTNIKVLEAMACGKAIVTTPVGCQGLGLEDGREALIRGGWADFAAAIAALLTDPALRAHLGTEACRTARSRFDWRCIAEQAYNSYQTLIAKR